jgi:DNA polymerase-3 subunit beta
MKLSIARGALLDSLSVVTKALSARTTLPILSGILMTATKDGITLQATDLEISIRDSVAANVEGEGSVVVPGRLLTDVVRQMPEAAGGRFPAVPRGLRGQDRHDTHSPDGLHGPAGVQSGEP